jgi:hypothetical protein
MANASPTAESSPPLPASAQRADRARRALRSPRAAAVAGLVFSLLYWASLILIRAAIPADPAAGAEWLAEGARQVAIALWLLPFAGIGFLWFMGVVRERFGALEDQLFATVFMGSGLLFLAMTFAGGAIAGGLLAGYAAFPEAIVESGVYTFARTVTYQIINLYAVRMSAVFMISSATMWVRTGVMPRWLSLLTYPVALLLLLSGTLSLWASLAFPLWVLIVSLYVLVLNFRRRMPAAG